MYFLDTYEKHLAAIGERDAVCDGKLTDILTLEGARPRDSVGQLLSGFQRQRLAPTLNQAVQGDAYEQARRRRQASAELN